MIKHFNIRIYGFVHGVCFRDTARRIAGELGVAGFARNDADGAVYIEAEGEEDDLEKFVGWCRKGPGSARVERVEASEGELCGYQDFRIEL